jgi:hypothetical protein
MPVSVHLFRNQAGSDRLYDIHMSNCALFKKTDQSMKTFKIVIGLFLLIKISWGRAIYSDEILDRENDFNLTIRNENKYSSDTTKVKIINKYSEKIAELKDWILNNSEGWESSIASWITPEISLIGIDFRLMIFKDGVVIGFTDKNGNARQYTKQVDKTEFDFLIN